MHKSGFMSLACKHRVNPNKKTIKPRKFRAMVLNFKNEKKYYSNSLYHKVIKKTKSLFGDFYFY